MTGRRYFFDCFATKISKLALVGRVRAWRVFKIRKSTELSTDIAKNSIRRLAIAKCKLILIVLISSKNSYTSFSFNVIC